MFRAALLAALFLPLAAVGLALSVDDRPGALKPTVFALRDARVVTEPGQVLPKATVVVRDGVIEAVGADVKAPPDALVMDGKGLTVYPGFLDALSNWGFDPALRRSEAGPPAPEDLAGEALAVTKPDNRKGMTPEFHVQTALKADDEQADNWRRLGFTAHLIAPEGGTIVGQSALVSLSGAPPREAVLRAPVAQHVAFRGVTGNDYPRSLMGIIAHTRQTFLDAGYNQRLWKAFEDAGRVGKRPPLDPALAELAPALAGKQPVAFEADSRDEIHRALAFADEFQLKPMVYGGRDAWKAVEAIEKKQAPVILRLNFSEGAPARRGRGGFAPPPVTPAPATPGQPAPAQPPAGRRGQRPPADVPAGADAPEAERTPAPTRVRDDQKRQQQEEQHNAAVLHEHKVAFAFSTQGLGADRPWDKFRANLRKAIDAGLPAEEALKSVTLYPAQILGVADQLGSIEPGKRANLVLTNGDLLQATTQVLAVVIDGKALEPTSKHTRLYERYRGRLREVREGKAPLGTK